jgi:hypothetical protein
MLTQGQSEYGNLEHRHLGRTREKKEAKYRRFFSARCPESGVVEVARRPSTGANPVAPKRYNYIITHSATLERGKSGFGEKRSPIGPFGDGEPREKHR